jgi:hypothetical protein
LIGYWPFTSQQSIRDKLGEQNIVLEIQGAAEKSDGFQNEITH